jgi:hypothetical protein
MSIGIAHVFEREKSENSITGPPRFPMVPPATAMAVSP